MNFQLNFVLQKKIVHCQLCSDTQSTAHIDVIFRSSSCLLVNAVNLSEKLELDTKSVWGTTSPLNRFSDPIDSY